MATTERPTDGVSGVTLCVSAKNQFEFVPGAKKKKEEGDAMLRNVTQSACDLRRLALTTTKTKKNLRSTA